MPILLWIMIFALIPILEVAVKIGMGKILNDDRAGSIAAYGVLSVMGAALCALSWFDMQMLQVSESYYVKYTDWNSVFDVVEIELTLQGLVSGFMLVIGAMSIMAGIVGMVVVFYRGITAAKEDAQASFGSVQAPADAGAQQTRNANQEFDALEATKLIRRSEENHSVTCPKCGTTQRADRNVCYECGAALNKD